MEDRTGRSGWLCSGSGLGAKANGRPGFGGFHRPALLGLFLAICIAPLPAREVRVTTLVEADQVYLGESFLFELRVAGGKQVEKPDMSGFTDFDMREIPQSWLRYRSGGTWDRFKFEEGESFLYRLVALRPGTIALPSVSIRVDGRPYRSPAGELAVTIPPPSEDFKLSLSLSRKVVYVGQSFELRAVWYYRKSGRYYYANVPILRHPSFRSEHPSGASGSPAALLRSFAAGGGSSGSHGTAMVGGILYRTVTFEEPIIPVDPGSFDFYPSTVQVWVPGEEEGSSRSRSGWNFDKTVVSAPGVSIKVLPLPLKGRPAEFSGIVSERLDVGAAINPEVMNVGDPVTLSISLSGPPSLAEAELPPLAGLEQLSQGFAVGNSPPEVETRGGKKVFRQTVRVKSEQVQELPPIEVWYFNTHTETYQAAVSRPFPITVRPTRIVTSADLVGEEPAGAAAVRSWGEGILHNYTVSPRLLRSGSYSAGGLLARPAVAALLGAPLLFLAAAFVLVHRRRSAARELQPAGAGPPDPSASFDRLAESLSRLMEREDAAPGKPPAAVEALSALRSYLGARLRLPPGRLGAAEVEAELGSRGIEEPLRRKLARRLELLEALRFQGNGGGTNGESRSILRDILDLSRDMEGRLPGK
jgi:hypothetical protein